MNNLDIVITMGGIGKRFRDAGYNMPKYMIEVCEKTLFEWSMLSLRGFNDSVNQYVFIALKDKDIAVEKFIEASCKKTGIDNYKLILLDEVTDGQATTVMKASKFWIPDNRLMIYNIDTYIEPFEMTSGQLKGDGFIPCFKAEGEHWSFVRLDDNGRAVEIQEKKRISDNCTLGAYYFKSCRLYSELYTEYYKDCKNLVNGEKYVAPLYNLLLDKGGEIYITNVPIEKVHVLGTPEELLYFSKNYVPNNK